MDCYPAGRLNQKEAPIGKKVLSFDLQEKLRERQGRCCEIQLNAPRAGRWPSSAPTRSVQRRTEHAATTLRPLLLAEALYLPAEQSSCRPVIDSPTGIRLRRLVVVTDEAAEFCCHTAPSAALHPAVACRSRDIAPALLTCSPRQVAGVPVLPPVGLALVLA